MIAEAEPVTLPSAATVPSHRTKARLVWFAIAAVLTVVIDQFAKQWIRSSIPLGGQLPLVPGWVHFSHVLNHGAAWGMLTGQRVFLIVVALAVLIVVGMLARDIAARGALASFGLALILGGAIGNLIDRIATGAVTDFIDLDTPIQWLRDFPVFNIADSALTVGVVLLFIDFVLLHRGEPETPTS